MCVCVCGWVREREREREIKNTHREREDNYELLDFLWVSASVYGNERQNVCIIEGECLLDISARGCVHPYQYLCVCSTIHGVFEWEEERECVYKIKVLTKQDASDVDSLQKEKFLTWNNFLSLGGATPIGVCALIWKNRWSGKNGWHEASPSRNSALMRSEECYWSWESKNVTMSCWSHS